MRPVNNVFDEFENEEEIFAVLCIYSQVLFVGLMWWWPPV